jgi:hypothetical protein
MVALTPLAALAMIGAAYVAEPSGIFWQTAKELGPQIGGPTWFLIGAWLSNP